MGGHSYSIHLFVEVEAFSLHQLSGEVAEVMARVVAVSRKEVEASSLLKYVYNKILSIKILQILVN